MQWDNICNEITVKTVRTAQLLSEASDETVQAAETELPNNLK